MKFIFSITTGIFWFSLYAYVPELSTFASLLGADYKLIGYITASYGLTQLILRIPLGIFSDFIGKRKIFIVLGLLISALSSLYSFLSPSPMSLLFTRTLAGISASTWVLFTVMYSGYFKKEEVTKSVGLMNSYNAVGQISAMLIGGFVSKYFGTSFLFLLSFIGAILGLILSIFIIEVPKKIRRIKLIEIIQIARIKKLQIVSILAILSQFITFATAFGFVPILGSKLGAHSYQLSILTGVAIIPGIFISRLAGTFFKHNIGFKKTIITGFIISSLLCIIMPFITSLKILYIAQFFGGVGRSMVFPLLMGIGIEDIDEGKRATAMGFFQAIYGLGMVLGPIILGFVAQYYGITLGFIITGFIGLTGLIITLKTIY